ncbi:MAG: peptidylprolyl isomerase [Chloroflexi bacterium]|nr:peptidylprolyl isomerase [Chloroflexota bacterium]MCI0580661.1 peptidylprolyl isomerase [Chloroflexota bacterium]MCI0648677.1 peptidylprolyl isomerase [Chloroflexota bacterium]MCI0728085.1 peptidylprolyl isomerase [Chloroflexota bacterium]
MRQRSFALICLFSFVWLVACGKTADGPEAQPSLQSTAAVPAIDNSGSPAGNTPAGAVVEPTATAAPPTPTLEPLAATVNGQPIFLADYEKELARYEQALGLAPGSDGGNYQELILNTLIDNELIRQAAEANGITVTPEMVDAALAESREEAEGEENFAAWLAANHFTEEEFRQALAFELLVEQVVAFVTADVPFAVEQIRARHIQLSSLELAQSLLEQIRAGADFAALAQQYSEDPHTASIGGDMGFFARGWLLVPAVEEAAFALQPGQVSEVIVATIPGGTETAYYIVQVVERDPQRPIADRVPLLDQDFQAWLAELRASAEVVRFVNTGA